MFVDSNVLDGFSEDAVKANFNAHKVSTSEFLEWYRSNKDKSLLIDARSPVEFKAGNIPGSVNVPLFSDAERDHVGKCFKHDGRETAIAVGLKYVVPKLEVNEFALQVGAHRTNDTSYIMVYCFRGGMRSKSMAWHLTNKAGILVHILEGGYKEFRTSMRALWDAKPAAPKTCVVAGRTGAGKTKVLRRLREMGQQVIDLEEMAHHKGSAFGNIPFQLQGYGQPTNEQYANLLAMEWICLDAGRWCFLEDEGPHCGSNVLPSAFYKNVLRDCHLVCDLGVPTEVRQMVLAEEYSAIEMTSNPEWKPLLVASLHAMRKRLGPERVQTCLEHLEAEDYEQVAGVLLEYYDRLYDKHLRNADGTGSGGGERQAPIVRVEHPAMNTLQLDLLCQRILDHVGAYGEQPPVP